MNSLIIRLGIISFFADVSSEMLYPITPIFLTTVLGASMTSVGLIEGCAEAIASLLKTYAGTWSDRIGKRKPFIILGYLFAALAKPLTGLATVWPQVLFARSFDRVGKGLRSAPRDAMLSESVAPELRGEAFGLHRAMDTMGATIGPILAIVYLHFAHDQLRTIYLLAFIPGLLAVLLAMSLREKKEIKGDPTKRPVLIQPWKWASLPKPFRRYLTAWSLFSIANCSDVFLLMRAKEAGATVTLTIMLYCFYNLIYAILSRPFGKWSDRIPRQKILALGLVVFALVYLGFSVASELWHFWFLFGVYGIYMAATDGVGKALAVDLFDPKLKATAVGILGTMTGISTVIASTIAGLLWDHLGSSWAFIYGALGAILATALLLKPQPS